MYPDKQRFQNRPQGFKETETVPVELSEEDALPLLQEGEVIGGQHIPWGSNYTFLVRIAAGHGKYLQAIYKPRDGERPLYDFPSDSLYKREYAAYLVSRTLGWPSIPLTLIRDGPYGLGSMQLYVESDANVTYFDLIADNAKQLMPFAVFDVVANNADRKAGHCMLGRDGRIWSIDHGLTFHSTFKMRTVMVEFWGARIPQPLLDDLQKLAGLLESGTGPTGGLEELLTDQEMGALRRRLEIVLKEPVIPRLDPRRNVPWPLK